MSTTLAKREPGRVRDWFRNGPLENVREEMRDLMSLTFGEEANVWPFGGVSPSLDLADTDAALEVRMDIPGVEAKDLDIQVNGNLLTIRGVRKEEQEEKGKTFHRIERRSGAFSRSIALPCPIKEAAIDAQYKNGILTVRMPKTEEAKAHKVTVKG